MTIAVLTLAVINTIALIYFGYVLYKIDSRTSHTYLETLKNRNFQIETYNKMMDLYTDVLSLDTRFDGFEAEIDKLNDRVDNHLDFARSADDNIAEMRKDIQKILDKFDDDDFQYFKGTLKRAREMRTDSIDYSPLYDKLFSQLYPNNTHLDDQKGDESNEQT